MAWMTMERHANLGFHQRGRKVGWQEIVRQGAVGGYTISRSEAKAMHRDMLKDEIWTNDLYQVNVRRRTGEGAFDRSGGAYNLFPVEAGEIAWLSIKRHDKNPVHDWRDIQRIKNDICGEECEGIELYPAESRLVDTANQYHIFVFLKREYRLPIGFGYRAVSGEDVAEQVGAKQRAFN